MAKRDTKTKARTNAEYQAAYRERHLLSPDTVDSERLNMVVPVSTKRQLERLARHYGVSQRAMLARLLSDAEREVANGLAGAEQSAYFNLTQ